MSGAVGVESRFLGGVVERGLQSAFFARAIASVGAAVSGDIVRLVSAGVFAPASAAARTTAQMICGVYDGGRILRRSMGTLVNFDSQPVLGSCYLSSAIAGKATCSPTYNLTIPRYVGEVVEVVDSTHAWVMLDCDANGSSAPFKILDYSIPGAGVGLLTVPNLSAKFAYDLRATFRDSGATVILRLRFNADGAGCFYAALNTTPAWVVAVSPTFPQIANVTLADKSSVAHAAIGPRMGGISLIEAKNAPESAGWNGGLYLSAVGSTTVDYTSLVIDFYNRAVSGSVLLTVSDPLGVG